jgi:uncharacterized integral membrane protein (TIGR00697 family)
VILDARAKLLMVLVATFVTCLIVGDLIGNKLSEFTVLGTTFTWSVGMIPFPVTFLLTDLLNEFYGKRVARTVTIIGFAMAALTFGLIAIAGIPAFAGFTHDPTWPGTNEAGFRNVFEGSQRMLIASMSAYLIGQFVDIFVFNKLKRMTSNRFLWLRATGSTAISQGVDTVLIQTIAFWGLMPGEVIARQAVMSYAIKLVVAVGLTPFIYAGHALVMDLFKIRPVVLGPDGEPMAETTAEKSKGPS